MAEDRTVYKLEGDASGLIRSLRGTSRALDATAKKADKTDKEIKQLGNQSKKTATKTKGLSSALGKLGGVAKLMTASAGMLAAGLLAAGAAAGKFLQSMADAQNELSDLSSRTGVATKTLAGLRLAAKGSGQDFKAVSAALKPLTLRLGQAAQGSKTAVEGFKAVGVGVLDAQGKLRSADEVILEISANLNDMEDPTERAAAAALAFGSAGTKLVQALGGQDLKVFVDAAERFGMDTGPAAAKAADDWQRAMANLDLVMRPFATDVLVWATEKVNAFMLGWVFTSTLLTEFGKNLLPNVGNLIKAFAVTAMIDINDMAYGIATSITGAFADVVEWIESYTGGDKWTKAFAQAHEETAKVKAGIDGVLNAQLVAIGTTTDLGKAYQKAFEEAKAFYEYLQIETTKPTGGGGLPGKDKKGGLEDIDLSKSGGAGIVIHDDEAAKEEVSTLLQMSDVVGTLAENMNELTDPTGVFRDLMGEIAGTFVMLEEMDFKKPMEALGAFGSVARSMGDIFGSVINSIIKNNDKLSKKQKKTLLILFALQKSAGLISIVIDTAIAVQKALAVLGPVAGPIAAGLITTSGIIQGGIVAAQKPPFHAGGIIPAADQASVPINALPGEAVLTREATAGLGTEGVANLNSGIGVGGSVQVIEMIYKHRIFDNFVSDNLSKGGPLNDAINGNRRVGHRKRG